METLLGQMIPLAVNRAGGPVWEYYFQFGGGKPPWTSAMSQGTGIEAPLSYHELVTGFLQQLCQRTSAPVYCVTGQHFTAYLTTPPALALVTQHARKNKPLSVRFSLSKYSHVGIVVVGPGGHTLF